MLFFELQPDAVMPHIGYIGEPLYHAQRKENRCVISQGRIRVALFDPIQRGPADRCPFRQNRYRYASPPASVAHVRTQFPERAEDRQRRS